MVYAQTNRCHGVWHTQTPMGLWHTKGSPNLGQTTRPNNNQQQQQKKKRIRKIVNFAVPDDHKIKLKESEKKDKYLDLARELKKLWNMKLTIIPIVTGSFGTVSKGLLKGLEELADEWRPSKLQYCWERLGDFKRLAVTQTLVENHQLTLVGKTP